MRWVAVASLALAVVALLVVFATRDSTYRYRFVFDNAGQLVKGDIVRVGGTEAGQVTGIELTNDGRADVTVTVLEAFAPLHEGTTATIRAASLSGIANRYVSLQPGPNSNDRIEDGGRIGADETSAPVDIDAVFNSLDAKTRAGLRNLIRGYGDWYDTRGTEAGESTKYFAPFLTSGSELAQELTLDQAVLSRFLKDGAATVSAIAERRDDLAGLVVNTNQAMSAIGDESVALQRALELLPGTMRKANTTFVNLRGTLDDLELLVQESKPATRRLAPFFRELRPLVADLRPTIGDLRDLIRLPGAGNDLTELTAAQPRLARLTADVFPRGIRALDRAQPVVSYARQYTPDLAGWITKFGQVAAYYDANGHYARVMPVFSPARRNADNTLTALPPQQRTEGCRRGVFRYCPGGAVQPPPDGSAPAAAEGCDPSDTPPGP